MASESSAVATWLLQSEHDAPGCWLSIFLGSREIHSYQVSSPAPCIACATQMTVKSVGSEEELGCGVASERGVRNSRGHLGKQNHEKSVKGLDYPAQPQCFPVKCKTSLFLRKFLLKTALEGHGTSWEKVIPSFLKARWLFGQISLSIMLTRSPHFTETRKSRLLTCYRNCFISKPLSLESPSSAVAQLNNFQLAT